MPKRYTNYSKTSKTPRKPFDRDRLINELRIVGTYGLRNKREVWRVQLTLAKLRKAARELLTLDESDPRRVFEGQALIRRIVRLGLLKPEERKLDYVLGLTVNQFMERRLQTCVAVRKLIGTSKKTGAGANPLNSIHHARVLIRQRHIAIGKQMVNIPSLMVRSSQEPHIDFAATSVYKTGAPGRVKRKKGKKSE